MIGTDVMSVLRGAITRTFDGLELHVAIITHRSNPAKSRTPKRRSTNIIDITTYKLGVISPINAKASPTTG